MMMENQTESDCCICLGEFKTPKVLPCIHTFCEECLQTHMSLRYTSIQSVGYKWISFPCPMCRHICEHCEFDENTPIEAFVKYFPINYYITPKKCAKHDSKLINMECLTSGIDMCAGCITDGHNGCLVSMRQGAKKQTIETLVDDLNGIIEAVSPWKNDGHRLWGNANEKKNAAEKQFKYFSEEYIRLEKKMTILLEEVLKMQDKICKTISAIDGSQENYTFLNGIGNANHLKSHLFKTFEELQTHATTPEKSKYQLFSEFDSELNSGVDNEIDVERNTSEDEPNPEEISYFFLSSKNRTECFKILNIKVLLDCNVIVLCQTPNKLVKLSWCGEFISELLFDHEPSDMCLNQDGEIAVSFSDRQHLDFVDVSESQVHITVSLETLRLYQKIASWGPNRLLACYSQRIDVLTKINNCLYVLKIISLLDSIRSFDYINGVIVFSNYTDRHIYSYNIAKERVCVYYLQETRDNLPLDISCSPSTVYSLFTEAYLIHRMQNPDSLVNKNIGHLFLGIGNPYKIHVNNSKVMAVCSTNRKTDRFLVQIFNYSNLTPEFCF